jgi:hypothetical protein
MDEDEDEEIDEAILQASIHEYYSSLAKKNQGAE